MKPITKRMRVEIEQKVMKRSKLVPISIKKTAANNRRRKISPRSDKFNRSHLEDWLMEHLNNPYPTFAFY